MPGLKFGLVLGSTRFAALVGAQKACRILDSSETFDAAQAHGMGFATQVSEEADWPEILRMALDTSRSLNPVARGMLYEALADRSEEHTSELQSLMRISYAVL